MDISTRKSVDSGAEKLPNLLRWEPPQLSKLPPLTELTLATGGPIGGGGGGGGTVF